MIRLEYLGKNNVEKMISIALHSVPFCSFFIRHLVLYLYIFFSSPSLLFLLMHYHHHHHRRELHRKEPKSFKHDRDVGLSFLYHSTNNSSRLSQITFPAYYSLAYLPMPYLPTNTRSVHSNFQILLYNFLERPAGFKCFLYHFLV